MDVIRVISMDERMWWKVRAVLFVILLVAALVCGLLPINGKHWIKSTAPGRKSGYVPLVNDSLKQKLKAGQYDFSDSEIEGITIQKHHYIQDGNNYYYPDIGLARRIAVFVCAILAAILFVRSAIIDFGM